MGFRSPMEEHGAHTFTGYSITTDSGTCSSKMSAKGPARSCPFFRFFFLPALERRAIRQACRTCEQARRCGPDSRYPSQIMIRITFCIVLLAATSSGFAERALIRMKWSFSPGILLRPTFSTLRQAIPDGCLTRSAGSAGLITLVENLLYNRFGVPRSHAGLGIRPLGDRYCSGTVRGQGAYFELCQLRRPGFSAISP